MLPDTPLSPVRRLIVLISVLVAFASGLTWFKHRESNPVLSRRARTVAIVVIVFGVMVGTQRLGNSWESEDLPRGPGQRRRRAEARPAASSCRMAEHEVDALIAQVEKITAMARGTEPLSEEQRAEFRLSETLMLSVLSHRGPDYDMTEEQARRLGQAMRDFKEAMAARGVAKPSPEEIQAMAQQLRRTPPPARN